MLYEVITRLELEVRAAGDALEAMAVVVYGDPPEARVHGDRFVQLGRRPIERDDAAERRLVERLRRELDLVMVNGVDFDGTTADAKYNNDPMRFWENDGTVHVHDTAQGALLEGWHTEQPRSIRAVFSADGARVISADWNGRLEVRARNGRITSYNVCYTKLLRGWSEAKAAPGPRAPARASWSRFCTRCGSAAPATVV